LRVAATRIGDILRADKPRAISADTPIRYFGTSPEFRLNRARAVTGARRTRPCIERSNN
jgi:hypothetical protein